MRVFRLVTNTPIEERILSRAHGKLSMENLVIEAGGFNTSSSSSAKKSKDNAADRKAMIVRRSHHFHIS